MTPLDPSLLTAFTEANQQHVFTFYDELDEPQRQQLLADARHIDPAAVNAHYAQVIADEETMRKSPPQPEELTPFTDVTVLKDASEQDRGRWYEEGLRAIADGRVATVLMAGGQGTRLGSSEPKGCFDINLPSHKSLFQLQADRIHRLRHLAAAFSGRPVASVSLPWYVMTSIVTHEATIAYFALHRHFSLPEADCLFFQQRELPALSNDGRILLESRHRIALSPNGNGGLFDALNHSGSIADMQRRGIQSVHVYGVDNVLVRVADPTLVGFARVSGSDCVNKVVLKEEAGEKVGVMSRRAGRPHVVEYSEMPKQLAELRGADGRLVYSAGNIAQHFFSFPFLAAVAAPVSSSSLPFHIARKAIPHVDCSTGSTVSPSAPNGIKMEMFIFDSFPLCREMRALAVERDDEFSGVKNREGADSPHTARAAVGRLHKRWVEAAGGKVQEGGDGVVEVAATLSYGGEGLEAVVNGNTYTPPVLIS